MTERRLGLDLGTNSIGWCLLNLDADNNPCSIFKTGVRIFNDGRDPKTLTSLKATRREARSARRRRDRFLQRQKYLLNTLVKMKLMSADEKERQTAALKDPYSIRKAALDSAVAPEDLGRAIFHINQRRGFKSNRKSGDNEAGVVKQSVAALEMQLMERKARTFGEFLADRHAKKETVRARRLGPKTSDLYEFYPDRAMLEHEFDLLWSTQASFNPELYTEEKAEQLKDIIFFQRKLKPQEVGRCTFLPEEKRMSKALPSFQRFRIYQELANLCWIDKEGVAHRITNSLELRDRLFNELEQKKKLTFKQMRAILKKLDIVDYPVSFNLESDSRDHLIGNLTSALMCDEKKMIGARWDGFDEVQQDNLILLLQDDSKDDEQVSAELISDFHIPEERVEALLDARLPDGHGALSRKAIDKIVPILKDQGLIYYDAVKEAGFGEANLYDPNAPLSNNLDYYGKALSGHVMNASGKPEDSDEVRFGIITNPTVHISLNQIRQVVNEIIRVYGKPAEIVLEIGRDLPLGADGKRELKKMQGQNLEKNNRAREELTKLNIIDSRENRQKYQLWEQLSDNPIERRCPFTGRIISLSELFTPNIEVEHLLPFSSSLDDSMANKTVCYREANREKGKCSPYEAFGHSPSDYSWEAIMERAEKLPYSKRWRFLPDAMERFAKEGGFLERQLNDTRYISRYTAQYLSTIIPKNKIWVATGRLTALLRGFWGLNSVMKDHNQPEQTQTKKSRDDHRHHAVDAIVVGMTSRGMLQQVSTAARRSEELTAKRLFDGSIDPYEGFRDEVKKHIDNIIISHRPRKKAQGPLHNDTAYGLVDYREGKASTVVRRKPVEGFVKAADIDQIRDPQIRGTLSSQTSGKSGAEFQEAVVKWCANKGIKSLRILEEVSVIPIKDQKGLLYKGYKGDGNAYMEVYKNPQSSKFEGEIISRFNANQKNYIPSWRQNFPTEALVARLRINDLLALPSKDGNEIWRIQKMSGNQITLALHNEANVDTRNRSPEDPFKFKTINVTPLFNLGARKIHISPIGLIMT